MLNLVDNNSFIFIVASLNILNLERIGMMSEFFLKLREFLFSEIEVQATEVKIEITKDYLSSSLCPLIIFIFIAFSTVLL